MSIISMVSTVIRIFDRKLVKQKMSTKFWIEILPLEIIRVKVL